MRAWRPAVGGRCSSVGSRLSTKQTYVYIGDADSATPASKYLPPWLRRGTSWSVYASQEQNALRGLIHPRENLMLDFFFFYSSCGHLCHLPPRSSSSILLRILSHLLRPFLQYSFNILHISVPLPRVRLAVGAMVILFFVVATCQSKASHTSYRLVVS